MLSQIVHILRSNNRRGNLDAAINIMLEESLDAYILQEAWLDRTDDLEVNIFHVFTHMPKQKTCNCGQMDITTILATSLYKAYTNSGSPLPIVLTDPIHPVFGQFIGAQINLDIEQKYNGDFKKNEALHKLLQKVYASKQ